MINRERLKRGAVTRNEPNRSSRCAQAAFQASEMVTPEAAEEFGAGLSPRRLKATATGQCSTRESLDGLQ